jgi:hypothetical protein
MDCCRTSTTAPPPVLAEYCRMRRCRLSQRSIRPLLLHSTTAASHAHGRSRARPTMAHSISGGGDSYSAPLVADLHMPTATNDSAALGAALSEYWRPRLPPAAAVHMNVTLAVRRRAYHATWRTTCRATWRTICRATWRTTCHATWRTTCRATWETTWQQRTACTQQTTADAVRQAMERT